MCNDNFILQRQIDFWSQIISSCSVIWANIKIADIVNYETIHNTLWEKLLELVFRWFLVELAGGYSQGYVVDSGTKHEFIELDTKINI